MSWRRALLILLIVSLAGASPAFAKKKKSAGVMVDSLVATVDNETISIEDVQVERDILSRTNIWFSQPQPPANPTEKDAFNEMITRSLLYNQARKMGFTEVPDDELETMLEKFRATFTSREEYTTWLENYDLRDEDVKQTAKDLKEFRSIHRCFFRCLIIEKYLTKKIDIQVKLGLPTYLADHEAELRQKNPQATAEELKSLAEKELYNQKLKDHIAELKSRSNVVILRDRYN
ncbi:MAG: hypothetical protein GX444_11000 [Myxococcales bacterium]|nr:hypothetical protein [Myxococcales bacterium]